MNPRERMSVELALAEHPQADAEQDEGDGEESAEDDDGDGFVLRPFGERRGWLSVGVVGCGVEIHYCVEGRG